MKKDFCFLNKNKYKFRIKNTTTPINMPVLDVLIVDINDEKDKIKKIVF
jgi:hypothetical protein